MKKSQPDGTHPMPETGELGSEGGSFGDSASRESRKTKGEGAGPVDEAVTDVAGNAIRLPEVHPDNEPPAAEGLKKYPTES